MERTLIFGATGSVGAYTALHLKSLGKDVIAVGKRLNDNGFFQEHGIPYYSVDITNRRDFSSLPSDITNVVHLAGSMPSKMKDYHPEDYLDSVVKGTFNVLEYCRIVGAKKIVFTQTRADSNHLMGSKTPIPSDIDRKFPLKGDHSIYTICKNAAVDLIEHYYHQYGIARFIVRLPTIYAYHPNKYFYVNGQKRIKAYRLLIDRAINGDPIEIWGDPSLEKEIVYVKDLTRLITLTLDAKHGGGIYNIGNGKGISLKEQILGIIETFSSEGRKSDIVYKPEKPNAREFTHDISKTVSELGFTPTFSYLESLRDFQMEMQNNRFAKLWGNESE